VQIMVATCQQEHSPTPLDGKGTPPPELALPLSKPPVVVPNTFLALPMMPAFFAASAAAAWSW
jgi:hypothetical protein